jgi:hypothetical protein
MMHSAYTGWPTASNNHAWEELIERTYSDNTNV